MMKIAVVSGSFDPITAGHMDLVDAAAGIFDMVYIAIVVNGEKTHGLFPPGDRLRIAERAVGKYVNVHAAVYSGLLSDYCSAVGAKYLIRGVRNGTDFAYEYDLAAIMRRFDPELTTVFLPSSPEKACISSTYVRELLKYNCPLEGAVPDGCESLIRELYNAL